VINVQSTLRITPSLYENVALAVLFGGNSNSYTISTQSDMCVYAHILHNIDTVLQKKQQEIGTAVNAMCQGNLCPIGLTALLQKLYRSDDGLDVRLKLVTYEKCDCVVQDCLVDAFIDLAQQGCVTFKKC